MANRCLTTATLLFVILGPYLALSAGDLTWDPGGRCGLFLVCKLVSILQSWYASPGLLAENLQTETTNL